MNADLLLFNRRVTTLDRGGPEAQAIAIEGGCIAAIGGTRELTERFPGAARRIDLGLMHG